MSLPYDVARCVGTTAPLCEVCRRREPGRETWQAHIAPEWTLHGCPNFIEPLPVFYSNNTARKQERNERE